MIEIKNLKYSYPDEEDSKTAGSLALDDVSLTIKDGEFITILGHNGSGKSTLAKMLNVQIQPLEGDVIINGFNTKEADVWEVRKNVGMVFQNPDNQMVATIVEEDVAFGPENLGVPNPELRRRVDDALETVGMTKYKKHAPHMLSGGQKQRVAIAGVLAMNPDIVVFDEPTAMLDPHGRGTVMRAAKMLNKEKHKTIINITHYMDEAVLSDRIFVMEKGKIVLEGTPQEVFSNVEKIKKLHLDVPQVTELAYLLKDQGFKIRDGILNIDELVEVL